MSDLHVRENTDVHVNTRDLLIEKETYERNPQKSPICARGLPVTHVHEHHEIYIRS